MKFQRWFGLYGRITVPCDICGSGHSCILSYRYHNSACCDYISGQLMWALPPLTVLALGTRGVGVGGGWRGRELTRAEGSPPISSVSTIFTEDVWENRTWTRHGVTSRFPSRHSCIWRWNWFCSNTKCPAKIHLDYCVVLGGESSGPEEEPELCGIHTSAEVLELIWDCRLCGWPKRLL